MSNRYDQLSVMTLLPWIQEQSVLLEDKEWRKKQGATKIAKLKADMADARYSVTQRLAKTDRMNPLFFPLHSYVEYLKPEPDLGWDAGWSGDQGLAQPKMGRVSEHSGTQVLVQFDGEEHHTWVEPVYLKLRFLRAYG